ELRGGRFGVTRRDADRVAALPGAAGRPRCPVPAQVRSRMGDPTVLLDPSGTGEQRQARLHRPRDEPYRSHRPAGGVAAQAAHASPGSQHFLKSGQVRPFGRGRSAGAGLACVQAMVEHAQPIADRVTAPKRELGAALDRAFTWTMAHAVLFPVAGLFVVGVVGNLPSELLQDMWLAVAGGREVVEHGLPHHDTLAIWTHGREWVDQQWLAQLFYYGLYAAGGIK